MSNKKILDVILHMKGVCLMKILPINNYNNIQKNTKNNNFKARLIVTRSAEQAVIKKSKFRSVMESFRNAIKNEFPKNTAVTVDANSSSNPKAYFKGYMSYNQKTDNNPYTYGTGPIVVHANYQNENLSLQIGKAKGGFLFNENDDEKQILADLLYAFRSIRAHCGISPSPHDPLY